MVWQDFPFANMDYPVDDASFRALVESEVSAFLEPAARHASLTILCGGSEIEQQAAMLGIAADFPLLDDVLPASVARADVDLPFVRSTPTGGNLPFRPGAGVAHYFGVGAYRRSLADARLAGVQFAAECLAFAHVPDVAETQRVGFESELWRAGVPRDNGADWDFGDVRDYYLEQLYGVHAPTLRGDDPERYLALSRVVTGEVTAATLGEWRRQGSTCSGALLWCFNDTAPGPGWGIVDVNGHPKPAFWLVRPVLQPVGLWMTDEGLNGVDIHVANDHAEMLAAVLEVHASRADGTVIAKGTRPVEIPPRGGVMFSFEEIVGSFLDASLAYAFGRPGHDVLGACLRRDEVELAKTAFYPCGRGQPPGATEAQRIAAAHSLRPPGHQPSPE
jgi:beta-mannosidase